MKYKFSDFMLFMLLSILGIGEMLILFLWIVLPLAAGAIVGLSIVLCTINYLGF